MAAVILVDSNIPMYLVGADDDARERADALVAKAVAEGKRLVTDAEVLQEIVHRYAAIGRHQTIQSAFDVLLDIVVAVHPITLEVVTVAKDIALAHRDAKARDTVHVAVTRVLGIPEIMSFDRGLERIAGVRRYGA